MKAQRFPGFPTTVIAGAPKCGTSSLFAYLADHPEVKPSSVKETRFLIDPDYSLFRPEANYGRQGLAGYARFFEYSGVVTQPAVYLEATPDYMYQETALRVLSALRPRPKIVFVLRAPSDRIYSLYKFASQNMSVIPSTIGFAEFLRQVETDGDLVKGRMILRHCIQQSRYVDYLEKWYREFESGEVEVLIFEELVEDPRRILMSLCSWLEIDPSFFGAYSFGNVNESITVRNRFLHQVRLAVGSRLPRALRLQLMKRIYRALNVRPQSPVRTPGDMAALLQLAEQLSGSVAQLEALIGRDLSIWRPKVSPRRTSR